MWHEWWVWASGALVLAILEVVLPGYIFLGFAIGAAVMAVLFALGGLGLGLPVALVLWAGLSLLAFMGLRRVMPNSSGSRKVWTRDIND